MQPAIPKSETAGLGGAGSWRRTIRRFLPVVPLAATVFALVLLRRQLEQHSLNEIMASARATPGANLALALFLTVLAYLALTGYDWVALRYIRSPVAYSRSAPISIISYGIGNALGFPLLTSTPLRFRLYSAVGLTGVQVIQVISFTMASFWLGLHALGGSLLVLEPQRLARMSGLSSFGLRIAGALLLAVVVSYVAATLKQGRRVRFFRWQLEVPGTRVAVLQVLVSSMDWLLTAGVLWALLPHDGPLGFPTFLAAYLLAQMLALLSHVPGGIGVFEAGLIGFLAQWVPAGDAAGALLLFRLFYYLAPLAVALVLLVALERRSIAQAALEIEDRAAPWLGPIVPRALAIATFGAGAFLVVSGSLPALSGRLQALSAAVPLALIESSHLVASVAGVVLLILSRGLARRLDGAWHVTLWILGIAMTASLLRGLDWEEAGVLGFVLVLLLLSRRHFYRRASLLSRPFSARWLVGVGVVLVGGVWLGLLAHKDASFTQDQLWRFSWRSDVPRFLRAQVAIASAVLIFGVARLFRGAPPSLEESTADLEDARKIVLQARSTGATLALLGDKHFLFDAERTSFIMFGISNDSWISMGDPIGDPAKSEELIWQFREQCDLFDERPVFYQVLPDNLPLYLEAGLSVIKLGESARTPLDGFSLEGSHRKDLRQRLRKAEREKLQFEIVPVEGVPALLPEMREISDEWLADKNASEKSFSLGAFVESYLVNFPCALVRQERRAVAFANVLLGADKAELSVDLMRYRNDAPPGVMDYLFIQLMVWGSAQGYHDFHLGMAPLAGLEEHTLAPTWNRMGAWLFRHGEHFYNFQGLRSYKEKFDPVWEPRYLAAPDGLATSRALLDVATLISGGLAGLVRR